MDSNLENCIDSSDHTDKKDNNYTSDDIRENCSTIIHEENKIQNISYSIDIINNESDYCNDSSDYAEYEYNTNFIRIMQRILFLMFIMLGVLLYYAIR